MMPSSRVLTLIVLLLIPGHCWAAQELPDLLHERMEHRGARYDVVRVDLKQHTLSLHWKRPDGQPHGSIRRLKQWSESQGRKLLFATNAGIYARDKTPLGLHVEEGKELRALNRGAGGGNFFLQPNGVFYLDAEGPHVVTTEEYARRAPQATLATQSGPLLVIDGELHPRFITDSSTRFIRNGVGVLEDGGLVFVISRDPVIFHDFGTFFQEKLGCRNALYLDGKLSAMYAPVAKRHDAGLLLVGILAVEAAGE